MYFFIFAFLAYFIFCHFREERAMIMCAVFFKSGEVYYFSIYSSHTHMCACICVYTI